MILTVRFHEEFSADSNSFHILVDPLNVPYSQLASTSYQSYTYERKPKVVLSDREMYLVHLLRENNIRTMDIAKLMSISERSVSRLVAKLREAIVIEIPDEVFEEAQDLIARKDEILSVEYQPTEESEEPEVTEKPAQSDESKRKLAFSLLAMNVKLKDISKMLCVPEKTIQLWKAKQQKQKLEAEAFMDDDEDLSEEHFELLDDDE